MPSTFTSLHFHIVFGTKNREPFLTPAVLEPMHHYLGGCIRSIGGTPLEIGGVALVDQSVSCERAPRVPRAWTSRCG